MIKTYRECLLQSSFLLEKNGCEGYAIIYLFLERKKWNKTQWLLKMWDEVSEDDELQIQKDLKLLLQDFPVQYLLGYQEFYGRKFKVTSDTFIPRPETEELVELCLKEVKENVLDVVDVGTGSGCISITLKLEKPNWNVKAIDLSSQALSVAKYNAKRLNADINFYNGDCLDSIKKVDLIISNPPYISKKDLNFLDKNVKKFEPKMALFSEKNGLEIYEKIIKEAQSVLSSKGRIFLEIGFKQGKSVKNIFKKFFPKKKPIIYKDISGKDRIITI